MTVMGRRSMTLREVSGLESSHWSHVEVDILEIFARNKIFSISHVLPGASVAGPFSREERVRGRQKSFRPCLCEITLLELLDRK